jgi:sterol 14-demethylase
MLDESTSALGVMYPWLPLLSTAKRNYAGARLYMVFNNLITDRKKHNRTEDDAMQYLLDQGDNVVDIITVSGS